MVRVASHGIGGCGCEGRRVATEDTEARGWCVGCMGPLGCSQCWCMWGMEGRADALAGGAAKLDAIEAQLSSLGGLVFMAQRHVDSIGERAV